MPEHEKSCEAKEIVERLTNTRLTTAEPAWKKTIPKINAGSTEVRTAPPPGFDPLYKGTQKARLDFYTSFQTKEYRWLDQPETELTKTNYRQFTLYSRNMPQPC